MASFQVIVDSSNCTTTLFHATLDSHELTHGTTFAYYYGTPYNPTPPTFQPVTSFPANSTALSFTITWQSGLFVSNSFFPLTFDVRNSTGQLLRIPHTSELDVQTKQVEVRCQPRTTTTTTLQPHFGTSTTGTRPIASSSTSSTIPTASSTTISTISSSSPSTSAARPTGTDPGAGYDQFNAENHKDVPKIVGAVVGSILGAALLALLLLFCGLKRRRQKLHQNAAGPDWDDGYHRHRVHAIAERNPIGQRQHQHSPLNWLAAKLPGLQRNRDHARRAPKPPSTNPFETENMRSVGGGGGGRAFVDADGKGSLRSEYAKKFAAAAVLASQLASLLSGHARHARGERHSVPATDVETNHVHIVATERQEYEHVTRPSSAPVVTQFPQSSQSPRSITPISPLPPMQTAWAQQRHMNATMAGPSRPPRPLSLSLSPTPTRSNFERGSNRNTGYGASAGRFLDAGPALSSIQSEPSERTTGAGSSDAGQKEVEQGRGDDNEEEVGHSLYPIGRKSSAGNLYSPVHSMVDTTEREDLATTAAASHRSPSEPPTPSTTSASDSGHSRFGFIRIRDRPLSSGNEQSSSLDRSRQSTPTSVPTLPSVGGSRPNSAVSLQRPSLSPRPSPPAVVGPRPMVLSPPLKPAAHSIPLSSPTAPAAAIQTLPAQSNRVVKPTAPLPGPMSIPMPPPLAPTIHPALLASPVQTPASQLSPEELKAQALLSGWVIQGEPSPQPGHQSWLQQRAAQQDPTH
ncbi:hypothetical protein OC846_005386 [Tilletia horrida]|uniref:Uncharacterized protein n=1 Tax=Tilletia horrida TaxID=155126 RepID=A0AAN6GQN9_9BASI|nr:hypothetical protein OC846_005386 [Tilletia horrida]KAK0548670.1 hypothetical protein OC845_003459 [Tilletia horrida]